MARKRKIKNKESRKNFEIETKIRKHLKMEEHKMTRKRKVKNEEEKFQN